MNNDLLRSYQQYRSQQQSGFLRIGFMTKIGLSFIFFLLLLSSLFSRKKSTFGKTAIINYGNTDSLNSVYKALSFPTIDNQTLRKTLPVLPPVFLKDIIDAWREEWKFIATNLPFLGVLAFRCGQYYGTVQNHKIQKLIVMQEYSYYMSYLTRLMENEGKQLFNIMHGIPGKEASYFRFTHCFVWGEYFKNYYIANYADPIQFIVSGSIYHQILKNLPPIQETIDILYMMQGDEDWVISHNELTETFEILKKLSSHFKIACKRHPQYPMQAVPDELMIIEGSPTQLMLTSKIILSHHSTSLLDAIILGKRALAFVKRNREGMLQFLPLNNIITSKEMLLYRLQNLLNHPDNETDSQYAIDDADAQNVILSVLKRDT